MAPPGSFSWTTFLLGFAIALWIALVILFLLPADDEPPISPCPAVGCCCGGGGPGPSPDDPLYIPSGPEPYTCANSDNGGGLVQDNGGGYVQDNGGGLVQDSAPRVPAPTPDTLGAERGRYQFTCENNDNGGGYVQDSVGNRSAVVPMERGVDIYCHSNFGHATVLVKKNDDLFYVRTYNKNQLPVTAAIGEADPTPRVEGPAIGTGWVFCTVPEGASQPQVVDEDNTCLAIAGGSC